MKVEILGRHVSIEEVSQTLLDQHSGDRDLLGSFDGSMMKIMILKSLDAQTKARILCHEMAHAILSISGVQNVLNNKQQEAVCDAMESWHQICLQPEFLKKMRRGKKV